MVLCHRISTALAFILGASGLLAGSLCRFRRELASGLVGSESSVARPSWFGGAGGLDRVEDAPGRAASSP